MLVLKFIPKKEFGQRNFVSKKFWVRKMLGKKIVVRKNFFGLKIIFGLSKFGSKNIGFTKRVRLKLRLLFLIQ